MGNRKVRELTTYQAEEKWPAVTYFKEEMLRKLIKNESKGGWEEDTLQSLIARLKEEISELEEAVLAFDGLPTNLKEQSSVKAAFTEAIKMEAADVGNFAMMVFDNSKNL